MIEQFYYLCHYDIDDKLLFKHQVSNYTDSKAILEMVESEMDRNKNIKYATCVFGFLKSNIGSE